MLKRSEYLYLCIGENFRDNVHNGYCGDVHTLIEWLVILTHKDRDFLNDFFKYDSDNDKCKYIFDNYGKRLQRGNKVC